MTQASNQCGINQNLIYAVMEIESWFRPDAVSPKGAVGLMQLMPSTAKAMGVDPWDPRENILGGTRYLRYLYETYLEDRNISEDDKLFYLLAAYNAGETRVFVDRCIPRTTWEQYVPAVQRSFRQRGDGRILFRHVLSPCPEPRFWVQEIQNLSSDSRAAYWVGDTLRIHLVTKNSGARATAGVFAATFPAWWFEISGARPCSYEIRPYPGAAQILCNMEGTWEKGTCQNLEVDVRLLRPGEAEMFFRFTLSHPIGTVSYPYCCGEWLDASGYPAKVQHLQIEEPS